MKPILIAGLAVLAVAYMAVLVSGVRRARREPADELGADGRWQPSALQTLIGFVTNFFDTLGIGNFAPTTAWFRYAKLVPDELIPGTMNVGHTLPVMLMAYLYIEIVEVESVTLVAMIMSAVVGAWLGANTSVVRYKDRNGCLVVLDNSRNFRVHTITRQLERAITPLLSTNGPSHFES